MNRINPIPTPKYIRYSEEFIPCRLHGTGVYGESGEKISYALELLPFDTACCEAGELLIYSGVEHFPEEILGTTAELFEEKHAKKQGYYLSFDGKRVTVAAYT